MNALLARVPEFFVANFPSLPAWLIGGPLGLAWSCAALGFAGWLKRRGVRTGYTRKTFHFLIFGTVAMLQWRGGTPAVCLFGATCSLAVFYAVWRGPGNLFYEAMAREKDEPHRTHFILVPYFTTLVGGLASSLLFGPLAIAGFWWPASATRSANRSARGSASTATACFRGRRCPRRAASKARPRWAWRRPSPSRWRSPPRRSSRSDRSVGSRSPPSRFFPR